MLRVVVEILRLNEACTYLPNKFEIGRLTLSL